MNTKEIWRLVPSIDGVMASSLGRLMVIPYFAGLPNGGQRIYGGQPTIGQWDGFRYIYVIRGRTYKVARLICEAFNGSPEPGQVCMHMDEDSRNNRSENLQWGSQKENLNAPKFLAYCRSRTGKNHPAIKGMMNRHDREKNEASSQNQSAT